MPASQIFYKHYPFKVSLIKRYCYLGGAHGKRQLTIDVRTPAKSRRELEEFTAMVEDQFAAFEKREEIRTFVDKLNCQHKCRMGGENSIFYFKQPENVMALVQEYPNTIASVVGPVSDKHAKATMEKSILIRESLYFNKFRYMIEFPYTEDFAKAASSLEEFLNGLDAETWRAQKLTSCIKYFEAMSNPAVPASVVRANHRRFGRLFNGTARKVQVYLTDPDDYIMIKLMMADHVLLNHEVITHDELS